ncbi:MAG: hypothetical protein H6Q72_4130 [Firmicutes bacterium]|nr:hypothetical protein [Bacillota bacterium]
MQGITEYKTPQGVHILRLHYTADPDKSTPEWAAEQRKGLTQAQWEREYEINFHVYPGKPWYPEFRMDFHVAKEPLQPVQGRPVVRGWDYGLTPATCFCQTTAKGQLLILYPELQSTDCGILAHGQVVRAESGTYFPGYQFNDYGDPAGNQRSQNDEKTANELLRSEYSITVLPGPVAAMARWEAVRKKLTSLTPDGQPMILIDPRCTWIIGAFTGGYHRKEVAGVLLEEPDKNEYSHMMDAIGYVAASIFNVDHKPTIVKAKSRHDPYRRR